MLYDWRNRTIEIPDLTCAGGLDDEYCYGCKFFSPDKLTPYESGFCHKHCKRLLIDEKGFHFEK